MTARLPGYPGKYINFLLIAPAEEQGRCNYLKQFPHVSYPWALKVSRESLEVE